MLTANGQRQVAKPLTVAGACCPTSNLTGFCPHQVPPLFCPIEKPSPKGNVTRGSCLGRHRSGKRREPHFCDTLLPPLMPQSVEKRSVAGCCSPPHQGPYTVPLTASGYQTIVISMTPHTVLPKPRRLNIQICSPPKGRRQADVIIRHHSPCFSDTASLIGMNLTKKARLPVSDSQGLDYARTPPHLVFCMWLLGTRSLCFCDKHFTNRGVSSAFDSSFISLYP